IIRREGAVYPSPFPEVPAVNCGGQRVVEVRKGVAAPPSTLLGEYVARRSGEFGFDTAEVTRFFEDGEFAAVESYLVNAYDDPRGGGDVAPRLTGYVRRFAWFGGRYVVVQDRLRLMRGEDPVRWLLHTPVQPVKAGDAWVVQNGGVLGVRTLLPADAEATVIGCPGREYLVDGRNLAPQGERHPSAGTHRIEVAAQPSAEGDVTFLHVLRPGADHAAAGQVDAVSVESTPGIHVVRVESEVLVLPEGLTSVEGGQYAFEHRGPMRHRVFGARPDTDYLVVQDGLELERLRSDASGSLAFDAEGGGRFGFRPARPPGRPDAGPGFVNEDPCAFGRCEEFPPPPCSCSSGMAGLGAGWALLAAGLLRRRRK
ncbi:MAG: hypothetical protein ACK4N5_09270, partial [Myxococcales bacterium]